MRIVQVTPYFPPHLGGMENAVKEISFKLARHDHKIEIYTSNIGCHEERIPSTDNLLISYLHGFEIAHSAIIPTLFFKLMRIEQDSIIHVHIAHVFIPEIVYLVSRIRGIPYIAQMHADVASSGKFGFLLPFYKSHILRHVLLHASCVVCLSNSQRTLIRNKYGLTTSRVKIISNGVDSKYFISRKIVSNKTTKLLYVGRLDKLKNLASLIKALPDIKHKVVLNIVGDGSEMKTLTQLVKDLGLKNVRFTGKILGEQLINAYIQSDIFIMPSLREGLPLVLLEAMASGLPFIASDLPEIRKLASESGLLVPAPTSEMFAKYIDFLISDINLRRTFSTAGRKKMEKYSWEKVVNKFEHIYQKIIYETNNK